MPPVAAHPRTPDRCTSAHMQDALQSENSQLRAELEEVQQQLSRLRGRGVAAAGTLYAADQQEVEELRAEFVQRLGTAERSVQALRDQRDDLRDELEQLKQNEVSSLTCTAYYVPGTPSWKLAPLWYDCRAPRRRSLFTKTS